MLYDRDGKMLWIADETGEHEILQPGGGFNGRTREPGEPDWWVVAKDPKWQPPDMMLASAPEQGPAESGSQTGDGSGGGSSDWGSFGKLAGADSEAGRKGPPPEPWSLLSAGQEHLDHIDQINGFGEAVTTIGTGIGEAVSKGAEGAGTALGKTWDALTTNEDLHKGVEFGGKAAWEVSKDVFKEAGTDAGRALIGYGLATKVAPLFGGDPVTSILRNRGRRLATDAYDLFDESTRRAYELDQKIRSHLPKD